MREHFTSARQNKTELTEASYFKLTYWGDLLILTY